MIRLELLHYELLQSGLPVVGVSSEGRIDYSRELTDAEKIIEQQVIAAHDPNRLLPWEQDEQDAQQAKVEFRNTPDWATWTAQESVAFVHDDVVSGMNKAEIEAWVDANVTTLATAKTALKLIGGELVDLRNICEKLAQAVIYLRDVAIRRDRA